MSGWNGGSVMGRVRELRAVQAESRDEWLAQQIDEVDARVLQELAAIRKTLNRILVSVVSVLIAVLTSSITALITGAVK